MDGPIAVVLGGDNYVRNYISSGVLDSLPQEQLHFLLSTDIKDPAPVQTRYDRVSSYTITPERQKRIHDFYNLLAYGFRDCSPTFDYRFRRLFTNEPTADGSWKYRQYKWLMGLSYRWRARRGALHRSLQRCLQGIGTHDELRARLRELRPALLLVPGGVYDGTSYDMIHCARLEGIPTLSLIDNWDNLCSKTVLWESPDYMAVWGEQTRQQAHSIQRMPLDRVTAIGSARFGIYYPLRPFPPIYEFPYILFCGCGVPFDELGALRQLDNDMSAHPNAYAGLKIIYRPHPWRHERKGPDFFRAEDFRHVQLDEQVKDAYYNPKGRLFQPDMEYYPRLLHNATHIILPPTSLMLEAMLCGQPAQVLSYDDGLHFTTPSKVIANYPQLHCLPEMPGVTLCKNPEQIGPQARGLIQGERQHSREAIANSVVPCVYSDERNYAKRLADLVDVIITQRECPPPFEANACFPFRKDATAR